jgi:hypothetical protein
VSLLAGISGAAPATTLRIVPAAGAPSRIRVLVQGPGAEPLRRALQAAPGRRDELLYLSLKSSKATSASPVPLLARFEWDPTRRAAVLVPQVSLTPGLKYLAVFEGRKLSPGLDRQVAAYTVPRDERVSDARVTAVYPIQATLPANLLKFYVHFSRPMGEGRAFDFIRLLDERGKPVTQPFRAVELWADNHRRLTLWINPGRTKRSLGLSESMGPVLESGRRYTLEIVRGLPDQHGRPLGSSVRRPFRTAAFDRDQPRIERWQLSAPRAGTRTPLAVRFGEPMDHALAVSQLSVVVAGRTVPGSPQVSADGRNWRFVPAAPWRPGDYAVSAAGELEDLAGNSLFRPFETVQGKGPRPTPAPPVYRRPFKVQ